MNEREWLHNEDAWNIVVYRWRQKNELAPGRPGPWHYSESPEWANGTAWPELDVEALAVTHRLGDAK